MVGVDAGERTAMSAKWGRGYRHAWELRETLAGGCTQAMGKTRDGSICRKVTVWCARNRVPKVDG